MYGVELQSRLNTLDVDYLGRADESVFATFIDIEHKLLNGPRTTGDGYYESCLSINGEFLLELTI